MPDDNPYKLDYVRGRKTLSETLEAFAQAYCEEKGLFAFVDLGRHLLCKKRGCGATFVKDETFVSDIIEHAKSHQSNSTLPSPFKGEGQGEGKNV